MANYPPFMNATGSVAKILEKIKEAQTPERFTQDFLSTKLGFKGGGAKAFIPLAKRIGLLASDGSPTDLYRKFRNPKQSKAAIAEAMKKGYPELYTRNEYTHNLDKKGLDGLIMEATGLKKNHTTLKAIRGTFVSLKKFADFEAKPDTKANDKKKPTAEGKTMQPPQAIEDLGLNLTYTINLVLPNTDDVAVFNAIFRSLKENLLSK